MSFSPPASPKRPMTPAEIQGTQTYLEQSKLPQLLEDFTYECALARPKDVVAFMKQWAEKKSNQGVLATSNSLTAALEGSPKKPIMMIVLGLEDRDEVLEDLDVEEEERSEFLKNHVKGLRAQLKAANVPTYSFAALETDSNTIILVNLELGADTPLAPSPTLMALLSTADAVVLKVSCESALRDFRKKREGLLYQQVLCSHACQIKNALVLLTNHRAVEEDTVGETVKEVENCLYNSGFARGSVPMLKFPASRAEFVSLVSSLNIVPRRKPRYYDTAFKLEVKVMVLDPDGLSVGESLLSFCKAAFHSRIDAIKAILDKATGKVLDSSSQSPFQVKSGEVGIMKLSCVNGAEVVTGAPIIINKGNKVAAFGAVTLVETEDDAETTDASDFSLSDGTE